MTGWVRVIRHGWPDGNHRVAAAAASDRSSLLALVTGGPALRIGAIHRALVGTGLTSKELAVAWRGAGLAVREVRELDPPARPGSVVVWASRTDLLVTLPGPEPDEPVPRIDHGLVERLLIADALGIDPEGPQVRALPAGHPVDPHVDAVCNLRRCLSPTCSPCTSKADGCRARAPISPRNRAAGCYWPTSPTRVAATAPGRVARH